MDPISLSERFARIDEHWRPKVVAALNGQEVKLVKFAGVFPWHHHACEDELFLVQVEVGSDHVLSLRLSRHRLVPF